MSTIIDDGIEYESAWTGTDGWLSGPRAGAGRGLLNSIVEAPAVAEPKRARISRQDACALVLETLEGARLWQTSRLREECELPPSVFEAALNRLRRDGRIVSVARGVVSLRLKVAA